MVCHMTWAKVKVKEIWNVQKWPISKVVSSAGMHVIKRLMVNNDTPTQYLRLNRTVFLYSSSFGVTWPSNLGCSTFDKRILLLTRSQLAVPYGAYFDVFDQYVTSCLVTRFLRNLWFCSLHSVTAGQPASLLVSCRLIIVHVCVHELLCHIVWAQFLDF